MKFSDLGDTRLSTLTSFLDEGLHGATRSATDSKEYLVESVSLNQLLIDHRAPDEIDYISIDTEGSEFEMLSAFDFDKYDVEIFTIEHNFEIEIRKNIQDLIYENGYKLIYPQVSHQYDWFIKTT